MSFNSESLPVELNGVSFLVDTNNYSRTTVPALREQRDNSAEAGENSLDSSGAWQRSQTDWSHGAGQTHFDLDDSDRRMFNSSTGIDPWVKGEVTLLPITEEKKIVTSTNLLVQRMNTYLYAVDAETVLFTTDATLATPTWTGFVARATYSITDIASDGTNIYLAFGSTAAIAKATLGNNAIDGAWPSSGTQAADIIHVAAGRLIGALGANIFEIGANGAKLASSLDYTPTIAGTTWTSVTGGPSGIFASANTDNTGSIYHIGVSATDGTLQVPIVGGQLPRGETVNQILAYGEILLITTSQGLRTALIDTSSNAVTIGPVIEEGGEGYGIEVEGRFVWWGGSNGQVYRANLSKFSSPLVPAWASDLVSIAGTGNVNSIARFGNKTYFGAVGDGVQGESGTGVKVANGVLNIGEVSWSTTADKLLRTVTVRQNRNQYTFTDVPYAIDPPSGLASGVTYNQNLYQYRGNPSTELVGAVDFTAVNDNNDTSTVSVIAGVPKDFAFISQSSVSYKFSMTLTRDTGDTTKAPIVEDWVTSCIATPIRIDEIIVPLVLRRQVLTSRNSGRPATFNSQTIFTDLRARMDSGVTVEYKEGAFTEKVTIERLSMQADRLSDDGTWWEGTLIARLLTVP
jgi:hypothetical protein